MKLDIEILQTQTAALQSFVHSSAASAVGFNIIQVVTRLKCDLSNEGEKPKRLELELRNLKNKRLELCSYRQNTDVANNFKANSLPNDFNQVICKMLFPLKLTLTPYQNLIVLIFFTRNTCMQQPLAVILVSKQVYFPNMKYSEIVVIFTLLIFLQKM